MSIIRHYLRTQVIGHTNWLVRHARHALERVAVGGASFLEPVSRAMAADLLSIFHRSRRRFGYPTAWLSC